MSFMKPPTPPPLAALPQAPQPPMTFGSTSNQGQKPQPKSQSPTFLSDALATNPSNTAQKNLLGT